MFWLLVACGTEVGGGGEAPIDVSVAPTTLSILLDGAAMYCTDGEGVYEPMGTFFVVNEGLDPVQVDVYATHTTDDLFQGDAPEESWMDVSVGDDVHRNLEPGGQMEIELFVMGRCDDSGEDVYDRFRTYVFEVEVLLRDEPTVVRAEVQLTPRGQ